MTDLDQNIHYPKHITSILVNNNNDICSCSYIIISKFQYSYYTYNNQTYLLILNSNLPIYFIFSSFSMLDAFISVTRYRFQTKNYQLGWCPSEITNMGHCRSRTVPYSDYGILQGGNGYFTHVRHHQFRIFQSFELLAQEYRRGIKEQLFSK